MSIYQSLRDMVDIHISRIFSKLPISSKDTRGTVASDNRTIDITDDVVSVNYSKIDPSLILVTSPVTDNDTTILVSSMSEVEIHLSATALIKNNYIKQFELTKCDNTITYVTASNDSCDCCILGCTNNISVVAIDNDDNRSLATLLTIEVISPTIYKPELVLPNTNIVNSNITVPYLITEMRSVPETTGYTCRWELTSSKGELLWNENTKTNHTSGPSGNSLTALTRSNLYELVVDSSIPKYMSSITGFENCLWYTTDEPGCVYKYDGHTHIRTNLPALRHIYKSYSDGRILVLCSMLYLSYTYNGTTWFNVQHPGNIVDIINKEDVLHLLSSNGTVYLFEIETHTYLPSIDTGLTACSNMCLYGDKDDVLVSGYEKIICIKDYYLVSVLLHIPDTRIQYVCMLDDTITAITSDTIYKYVNSWNKIYTEYNITNCISNGTVLCMTTSSNHILLTDEQFVLSTSTIASTINNIAIVNDICYFANEHSCYYTKPIVSLSEKVTLSAKYIATDARYPISTSVTHSYSYRLR